MVMYLNPSTLFGFPLFIFSVTTKWEKVTGTALGLGSSGFLCLLSGCHMFPARSWSAAVAARGITAAVVPLALGPGRAEDRPNLLGGAARSARLGFPQLSSMII